jgi:hypothetical protein
MHLRPTAIWSRHGMLAGVSKYFDAHRGEFSTSRIRSRYPYTGNAWSVFTELARTNPNDGYHYFDKMPGVGCWALIQDKIRNSQTADVLAAAEALSGQCATNDTYGPARGYGVDTSEVWIPLLDGGAGVEVHVGQDEETNKPLGWQRTTIRGPRAFRAIVELLGFDWIGQTLTGEKTVPIQSEISELVDTLLAQKRS